ncbi:PREDICTED: uncharacterized protein LOC105108416 isoform X3 [Populus euphratica]|uniref:Uncharacterized protein LOC105108416 isoform X3 n=1 Tax=Populus euphratica TaxID=75702 RepID=A0AAJ6X0M3_POPEU|nr:PREDICTED: uncharacterized protein LOC105108416 isoform X3 [Populus euphratica]
MNRPIIWICRRWTPWLMRWMNSLELYLSVVNLGGSHVSVMMKKSGILVVEDGTLAAFPVTFEEHKEELQSDIKAEGCMEYTRNLGLQPFSLLKERSSLMLAVQFLPNCSAEYWNLSIARQGRHCCS